MRNLIALFIIMGLVGLTSCQTLTELIEETGLVRVEVIHGSVSLNGEIGSGVQITAKGKSTTTTDSGNYTLSVVSLSINSAQTNADSFPVLFQKDGYEEKIVLIDEYQTSREIYLNTELEAKTQEIQFTFDDDFNAKISISDGTNTLNYGPARQSFKLEFQEGSNIGDFMISQNTLYTLTYTLLDKITNKKLYVNEKTLDSNTDHIHLEELPEGQNFTTTFKFSKIYTIVGVVVEKVHEKNSKYTNLRNYYTDEIKCDFIYSKYSEQAKGELSMAEYKVVLSTLIGNEAKEVTKYYSFHELFNQTINCE